MQMTMMTGFGRLARTMAIGALAIGAATMVLPGTAAAAPSAREISHRLDRISYEVERIPQIRGPHRQDKAIDNLQERLYRLDRITRYQRDRRARVNEARIDRLQNRLHRLERRVAYRQDRRDDRRADRRDYDREPNAWFWHDSPR
jgi:tetrahydromethanopterin S-methyltransferase subunit G